MAHLTRTYVVALVTENGEWLTFKQTDDAEIALQIASAEFAKINSRAFKRELYCRAHSVDVMKRNSQGDYDGLCSFARS